MLKRLSYLVGATLASIAIAWSTKDMFVNRELNLFVMAGQSNMQGYMGDASSYPRGSLLTDLTVRFFYVEPSTENRIPTSPKLSALQRHNDTFLSHFVQIMRERWSNLRRAYHRVIGWPPDPVPSAQWTRLGPQWGRFPKGHFGPEISFARQLHDNGFAIAIFKYSKESTSLALDWRGPGEGGLYDHFLATLQAAIRELRSSGYQVRIRGLLWIQGENDALSDDSATEYLPRLKAIIHDLRDKVLGAHVPIVLGADEEHPQMQSRPAIEAAQEILAATEPCVTRTSMRGLQKADSTHLAPAALVEQGVRLFDSFIAIDAVCRHPGTTSVN